MSVTLDPISPNNFLTVSNNTTNPQATPNRRKSSSSAATPAVNSGIGAASLKKAKWHLGIRSQSKPQDIMNEVFKAMKELGMVSRIILIFNSRSKDLFSFRSGNFVITVCIVFEHGGKLQIQIDM